MLDVGGRPVIEVTIEGNGPHQMILDTGASVTIVSPEWVGGKSGPVELSEIRIGALAWKNPSVISDSVFGGGPVPADLPAGVLSATAFSGTLLTLDYPGKTVSFHKGALPPADGRRTFQYEAGDLLPMVPVRVAGHETRVHVDSGSPGGLMLPLHFSKEVPLAAELSAVGRARTAAGVFDVFSAPVKGVIELGEYTLDAAKVRFSDLRPGPAPGPGTIGAQILATFKVTIDSANRRLLFER
jgi:hypothetical protein